VSTERENPDPLTTSVDATFCDVVSRREQFLERVQVVAQRIVYRVRRAMAAAPVDAPRPEPAPRLPSSDRPS
jgi:hypothetical protein